MRKKLLFYLRLGTSLLLVVWLVHSINFRQVWRPITPMGWTYLLLTVLLLNLDRVLMSYKWDILLKAKGIALSFGDIVRSYYVGTFWGIFLPSTVGGDVVRAYRVAKQTDCAEDIVSSVVMERVLGTVTGLFIAVVCMVLAVTILGVMNWRLAGGISLFALLFLGAVFLSLHGLWKSMLERYTRGGHGRWLAKLAQVLHSYQAYRNHRGSLLRFMLWTALEQCMPVVCVFLTAQALGLHLAFLSVVIFVPLIVTLAKIPITLDGFGVREGLYVYFLSFVGVPHGDAFVLGLISHVVGDLSLLPGFFYCSFISRDPSPASISA